jgi:hypothetical protein
VQRHDRVRRHGRDPAWRPGRSPAPPDPRPTARRCVKRERVLEMRQMRSRKPAKRSARVRLIMLCIGAAFLGIFLTVLVRAVRGYSALKTGLGYLPLTAGIMVGSGAAAGLVPRVGARPVPLAGARLRLAARTGCRGLASTAATPARCWARCWSLPSASASCSCRSPSSPCPAWRTRSPGLRGRPALHRPASRRVEQARRARHRRRRQPWSPRSSELMPVLSGPGPHSNRPAVVLVRRSHSCRVVSWHDRGEAAAVTRARLAGPREDAP